MARISEITPKVLVTAGDQVAALRGSGNVNAAFGSFAALNGWTSVAVHGAKGDFVADDTVAIQDAIDARAAVGGGVAFLPPGTFKISGTVLMKERVTLRGSGRYHTIIKSAPNMNADMIRIGTEPVYGWGIEHLTLDGNETAQRPDTAADVTASGIEFNNFCGLDINHTQPPSVLQAFYWINDIEILNAAGDAMRIVGESEGFVSNIQITRPRRRCMVTEVNDCWFHTISAHQSFLYGWYDQSFTTRWNNIKVWFTGRATAAQVGLWDAIVARAATDGQTKYWSDSIHGCGAYLRGACQYGNINVQDTDGHCYVLNGAEMEGNLIADGAHDIFTRSGGNTGTNPWIKGTTRSVNISNTDLTMFRILVRKRSGAGVTPSRGVEISNTCSNNNFNIIVPPGAATTPLFNSGTQNTIQYNGGIIYPTVAGLSGTWWDNAGVLTKVP